MTDTHPIYSGLARTLHWANAIATLGLISSGWAIFNAAAFYPITFPSWATLGGYLTGALRWHFLFMWVFLCSVLGMVALRLIARRGGPRLFPISANGMIADLRATLALRLKHDAGAYNHIQRALYVITLLACVLSVASGMALWKPVQFQSIADAMGGYEMARRVHFWAMCGISGFVLVHVAMVALVPSSLGRMLFGARLAHREHM
ncbi:cytochrome b/b6 domain-containing protein [uncultured Tateyamaria sp.]|uniref:cytochrome b/b6 domain-containing protein n=1 Tax=uncultured Tateyamaria sp. TaxID=455651 RepID=UPI00262AE661|nr:cytochrome b/b6 domain-containing protein [uncultured Tateyamaria sp.]